MIPPTADGCRKITPDPSTQPLANGVHGSPSGTHSPVISPLLPDRKSLECHDPRYLEFSTLADEQNEEDHLLNIDYNSLPTYPIRPSYRDNPAKGNIDTHLVSFDPCQDDPYRPASMPIYQTATFAMHSIEKFGPYDYTRSGNPTRTALEQLVASLEGAHAAFAFNSGMAAITAVTRLLKTGDEILCGDDIYGGAFRLFSKISARQGISVKFVDCTTIQTVEEAMTDKTRIVYVETPSNPLMRIIDLRKLAGTALAPFDSWLTLRGLKTLALRQEKQQANALKVAKFLAEHPLVTAVHYPGLARDPHEEGSKGLSPAAAALHMSQCKGGGSVVSFETGSVLLSRRVCDATKLFKITVSFGSCNSLIEMPCVLSHASIPKEMRSLPEDLVRLSIGVESPEDLLADLAQAMKASLEIYQKVKSAEIAEIAVQRSASRLLSNGSGGEGSLPSSSSSPSEAGEGGKAKAARAFPSDSGGSLANGDLTVSIPAAKKRRALQGGGAEEEEMRPNGSANGAAGAVHTGANGLVNVNGGTAQ
uniref:Cystathionine beta-lyase n=1 Tax=Chromera velia CCMP2878 TaxID=1169474 RepID=A0A0G4F2L0_9ALVE|eukprot:Cvel_14819.t1-p1 / transcript=Cvel_14819.t1 / gene=Cvel_14819 / organism=Chromera_velia_CCMP2878 / gene_product=Cystathionine beta-lyase, chloroplastic, putative / transcript_product=Cystathionine beta-lyase, chloroplastic, putative / location=Cvel_scaffold1069:19222-22225(-) / protein_length=533 / sequence_SO=supercontig / SO=protein_coding / is_pseudo=false